MPQYALPSQKQSLAMRFFAVALALCAACAAAASDGSAAASEGSSLCQLNDCAAVYTSDGDLLKGTAVTYSPVCAANPMTEGCVGASTAGCRICFFDKEMWPERRVPALADCDVCVLDFFGVSTPATLVTQSRMLRASSLEDLEPVEGYAALTAVTSAPTASPTAAPVAVERPAKRTEYCCPAGKYNKLRTTLKSV
jgi:hypothetical protein